MATNTAGKGPVGEAPPKANGPKAKSWVAGHKLTVAAILVVLLGLLYFLRRHAASTAAAADAAAQDQGQGANSPYAIPAAGMGLSADPSSGGFVDPNSLAGLLQQLATGQAGLADTISGMAGSSGTTQAGALTGGLADTSGAASASTSPAATTTATTTAGPSAPAATSGTSSGSGAAHKAAPHKSAPAHHKATAPKAKAAAHTYTVRRGDSLSSIASRLHLKGGWQALYHENRKAVGGNPNLVHPGLVLHY